MKHWLLWVSFVLTLGSAHAAFNFTEPFTVPEADLVVCADGKEYTKRCAEGNIPSVAGLIQITDLNYEGGFRLNGNVFGSSAIEYASKHIIAINNTTGNLLITGDSTENQRDIGEFAIPALSTSLNVNDLNIASNTQPFVNVFSQIPSRTVDSNETNGIGIYGLYEYSDNIIINYAVYYDSEAPINSETTFVKRNATDIGASTTDVGGSYSLQGGARASGWISPIPTEWQTALGGDHISGFTTGTTRSILSRFSIGPSAFVFNIDDLISGPPANGATITTTAALDYPYPNGLDIQTPGNIDTEMNSAGGMWTTATETNYCFIVPNTDTYMCLGYQAGFNSGLGYKIRNNTSQTDWGDYDANDPNDYRNVYYMFDVNDMVDAKNGVINTYDIVPYAWGTFDPPFGGSGAAGINQVSGAAYDPATGRLYVSIVGADVDQMQFSDQPVILVYTIGGT